MNALSSLQPGVVTLDRAPPDHTEHCSMATKALYVALLGEIGLVPLAVTTSLTINFLRKPAADKRVVAECKLMKVGRSLAVGEVSLYSEGVAEPVAHVVGTCSIPPRCPGASAG
jgi:acyl-coenzyme A thioesterase PaaI-like protein